MAASDVDLLDDLSAPEVIRNPYPYLAKLREWEPVHYNRRWKGWVVTSYEEVSNLHKNPALTSERYAPFSKMKEPSADQAAVFRWLGLWLGSQDPPLHTRLRSAISKAFQARSIQALVPLMTTTAQELLAGVARRGSFDLIDDFAYPLTDATIGTLLGMPRSDLPRVKPWARAIAPLMFMEMGGDERYRDARNALEAMADYFESLLQRRLADPQEDLVTSLAAVMQGGELSRDEVLATCMVVIFGGHETTKDLLGNGTLALIDHPDQERRLRNQPALLDSAIDEFLRYDGPAKSTIRWAQAGTTMGGKNISPGERLLVFWSAANRDPKAFPNPDRLDLGRTPNHHLAFGKGIHYCLGAPLGRLEAHVGFSTLLERLPVLKLAVPRESLAYHSTIIMRSLERLPLDLA